MLRRDFAKFAAVASSVGIVLHANTVRAAKADRKFTVDLCPGRIGVSGDQIEIISLAAKHHFESVEPDAGYLIGLTSAQRREMPDRLKEQSLVWGAGGMGVDFRNDDKTFASQLKSLPETAVAFQEAGVTRVGTWLSPSSDSLSYLQNFRQHAIRLRQIGEILGSHGLRFGLEYVGPKTLWASKRHTFVHSMVETKDLLAEIGLSNVGFVLDSWHWYTSHESVDDLLSLKNGQIVAVDLNDAPSGIDIDSQIDSKRELPCASGVIDLKAFLGALVQLEYDGPIRAEPFNQPLNEMGDNEAVAATSKAMFDAVQLLG